MPKLADALEKRLDTERALSGTEMESDESEVSLNGLSFPSLMVAISEMVSKDWRDVFGFLISITLLDMEGRGAAASTCFLRRALTRLSGKMTETSRDEREAGFGTMTGTKLESSNFSSDFTMGCRQTLFLNKKTSLTILGESQSETELTDYSQSNRTNENNKRERCDCCEEGECTKHPLVEDGSKH